jgi:hypothetical protein
MLDTCIFLIMNKYIPPLSQIVRNLVEEILKRLVVKNWIGYFLKRYIEWIDSYYLRSLDYTQASTKSIPLFKHVYTLVLSYFAVLWY